MKKGFCVHAFAPSLDAAAVTVVVAAVMEGERGCFMHASICILKAKALGTIAKKCKMGGFFVERLLIHGALRKSNAF